MTSIILHNEYFHFCFFNYILLLTLLLHSVIANIGEPNDLKTLSTIETAAHTNTKIYIWLLTSVRLKQTSIHL